MARAANARGRGRRDSSGSRRRVRRLPAPGAAALRELSGGVAADAAGQPAAHRRHLRVRPDRRRLCRRGRPAASNAGWRCSTTGARGCTTAAAARRSETRSRRPAQIFTALAETMRDVPARRRRCSMICSARFARTSRRRATRRGTTCSTIAGVRRIRSAGSCCASPATATTRWTPIRCGLHGAAAHQFLAGPRARLGEGTAVRAARDRRGRPAPTSAIWTRRRMTPAVAVRRCTRSRDRTRELFRRRPVRRRRRRAAASMGTARHVARRRAHSRPARSRRFRRVPSPSRRSAWRRRRRRLAGACSSGAETTVAAQDQLLLLVSRAAARRSGGRSSPCSTSAAPSTTASISSRDPARPRSGARRRGARKSTACSAAATPDDAAGPRASAARRTVRSAARRVRRARRRRRDGRARRDATRRLPTSSRTATAWRRPSG